MDLRGRPKGSFLPSSSRRGPAVKREWPVMAGYMRGRVLRATSGGTAKIMHNCSSSQHYRDEGLFILFKFIQEDMTMTKIPHRITLSE